MRAEPKVCHEQSLPSEPNGKGEGSGQGGNP